MEFKHNAATLALIMTSNLDEPASNESWGIKDFTLDFSACPGKCVVCNWDTRNSPEVCEGFSLIGSSLTALEPAKMDISGWTVTDGKKEINQCADASFLGGYNAFGKGTAASIVFKNLPKHNIVRLRMQILKVDTWDNEFIKVFVDDNLVY